MVILLFHKCRITNLNDPAISWIKTFRFIEAKISKMFSKHDYDAVSCIILMFTEPKFVYGG